MGFRLGVSVTIKQQSEKKLCRWCVIAAETGSLLQNKMQKVRKEWPVFVPLVTGTMSKQTMPVLIFMASSTAMVRWSVLLQESIRDYWTENREKNWKETSKRKRVFSSHGMRTFCHVHQHWKWVSILGISPRS